MSSKSKRYVVYDTFWFSTGHWAGPHRSDDHANWSFKKYTRAQAVDEIASYMLHECVKFVSDIDSVFAKDTYEYIHSQDPKRPGVKIYTEKPIVWICVKIIRNGKEEDVNLDALLKEVYIALDKKRNRKYYYRTFYKNRPCWKKQYKCKHQYEIHINHHVDTIKI